MATIPVRGNQYRSPKPPSSAAGTAKRRLQNLHNERVEGRASGIAAPRARTKAKAAALAPPCERVMPIVGAVCLLYVGLAARLFVLQVMHHAVLTEQARTMHQKSLPLTARRGVLLDRNGTLLVRNEPACAIDLDPNLWFVSNSPKLPTDSPNARKERTLAGLTQLLPNVDVQNLVEGKPLSKGKSGRYRTLAIVSPISMELGKKIKDANLVGVAVRPITKRIALNGGLAPHVLGFTGHDGEGLDGLENFLNKPLTGIKGKLSAEFDLHNQPIPGTVRTEEQAKNGRDVVLTLDARLQQTVQEKLQASCQAHKAEAGTAIVLDAKTGDILALANCPTYDVNDRAGAPVSARVNRAVSSPFEPGSTLKMVTVAAALEEKKIAPDTTFYCGGSRAIGKRTIHCALHHPFEHGHGEETALDVIKNSCNVATAECAFRLGRTKLAAYDRAFGLGEKTGAGLPGESRGKMTRPETWSDIQIANVGFGQGISVTPLQLAAAYGVIANDGVYQKPRIVWGAEEANVLKGDKLEPGRRVVSPETAREMRKMLQAVVDGGTGTKAQLTGYTAGGKTGTAQIAEHGSYQNRKFVASFVGVAPMQNPRFVILVSITDPKGEYYGGQVSAPVFKEIAEYALLARRVPHDKAITITKKGTGAGSALNND